MFHPDKKGQAVNRLAELQTGDNRQIVPNSAQLAFTPQPAGEPYPFKARYVRSGTVAAGAANARIMANITLCDGCS